MAKSFFQFFDIYFSGICSDLFVRTDVRVFPQVAVAGNNSSI